MKKTKLTITRVSLLVAFAAGLCFHASAQTKQETLALAEKTFNDAVSVSQENKADTSPLALQKFQEARALYHQAGEQRGEANALRGVGLSYLRLHKRDEAISSYKQALGIFEAISRTSAIAAVAAEIGEIYAQSLDQKELQLAADYYRRALSLLINAEDKITKAATSSKVARIYVLLRDKERSLEFARQALPIFEEAKDKLSQADALSWLAAGYDISFAREDKVRALEYYRQSIDLYSASELSSQQDVKNAKANALLNSGNVNLSLGNRDSAIQSYLLAIDLYRELKYEKEVALSLDNLGNAYALSRDDKDIRAGMAAYSEAAKIYLDKDEKPAAAAIIAKVGGWFFYNLKNKEQALRFFKQAITIYQEISAQDVMFPIYLARGFVAIGQVYEFLGDEHEQDLAIENYRKAQSLYADLAKGFEKQGTKPLQIQALRELGDVLIRLKDNTGARETYRRVATFCRSIPDTGCEASMLSAVGMTYSQSSQPDDMKLAISSYQASRDLFHKIGNLDGEIWTLKQIAQEYDSLNDWKAYLSTSSELLTIAASLQRPYREILKAEVNVVLGEAAMNRNENEIALANLESAREIGKSLDNPKIVTDALVSLVRLHIVLGNPATVLRLSDELIPMLSANTEHFEAVNGFVHLMRGYAYYTLNDSSRSRPEMEMAIQWLKEAKDIEIAGMKEALIGNSYMATGQKEQEHSLSQKIARGLETIKDDEAKTFALFYLALSSANSDDYPKALDYGRQFLLLSAKTNVPSLEIPVLLMLGFVFWEYDRNLEAVAAFDQALVVSEAIGSRQFEGFAQAGLMKAWKDANNPRLAIFFGKRAVNIFQELRIDTKKLDSELQKGYVQTVDEVYDELTSLLITQGRAEEAQQIMNRARDQEFFDVSAGPEQALPEIQFNVKERESASLWETKLRETGKALRDLQSVRANDAMRTQAESSPAAATYRASYGEYEATLKKIQISIDRDLPDSSQRLAVLDVSEMRAALCALSTSQRTYALYTYISDEKYYVLLDKCDGPVEVFAALVKEDDLNKKLLQFYALVQSKEYDPRLLGKELYDIVVPKALDRELQNDNVKTLLWSLNGNLRYIPVGALSPDGSTYLIERYNNVVFTRAKTERLVRNGTRAWTGYGFFTSKPHDVDIDKNRPGEAMHFGPLDPGETQIFRTAAYPQGVVAGDIFPDGQFTKESFLNTHRERRPLVHISSHFRFIPGSPDLSFLLLGDGHTLTLSELKSARNLFADVELLTLSACDTAAQLPDADGKEIDGFAELAQRLGAGSVIATLWSVSDVSTTRLMKGFYSGLKKNLTKAEALRQAQLSLLQGTPEASSVRDVSSDSRASEDVSVTKGQHGLVNGIVVDERYLVQFHSKNRLSHPYYWAPFILFGNSR